MATISEMKDANWERLTPAFKKYVRELYYHANCITDNEQEYWAYERLFGKHNLIDENINPERYF